MKKYDKEINEIIEETNIQNNDNNVPNNLSVDGKENKATKVVQQGANDRTASSGANEGKGEGDQNQTGQNQGNEKKKGRGRPKKSESEQTTQKTEIKDASNDLEKELSKYATNTNTSNGTGTGTGTPAQPVQQPNDNLIDVSQYISGALVLIALDAIFPSLIIWVAGMVDKKYKYIDKRKLKLTQDEKDELEPLADQVVKVLFGMVHPAIAFFVATAVIYAGKLTSLDEREYVEKYESARQRQQKILDEQRKAVARKQARGGAKK